MLEAYGIKKILHTLNQLHVIYKVFLPLIVNCVKFVLCSIFLKLFSVAEISLEINKSTQSHSSFLEMPLEIMKQ